MLDVEEEYLHLGSSHTAWNLYSVPREVMTLSCNPSCQMSMNMWSSMISPEDRGGQIVPSMLLGQWNSLNMLGGIINPTTLLHFGRLH